MRILTGGFAVWMGGWTVQVHHNRDIIGPGMLMRTEKALMHLRNAATEYDNDHLILPAVWALADGLFHQDHAVIPPDEIDPDYLEGREDRNLEKALLSLGSTPLEARILMEPYLAYLNPDHPHPSFG